MTDEYKMLERINRLEKMLQDLLKWCDLQQGINDSILARVAELDKQLLGKHRQPSKDGL